MEQPTTTTLRHYDTNNYDTINHEEREGHEELQMKQPTAKFNR